MDKKTIRKKMIARRNEMQSSDIKRFSRMIEKKLIGLPEVMEIKRIYIYCNINSEVETRHLINELLVRKKHVLLPKVNGKNMDFYEIGSLDECMEGTFHVLEPITEVKDLLNEGVMIIPGVAFDKKCNRMGYGGGFYDRFLSEKGNFKKIAICFDNQIIDELETQDFDIKMDMIVTQTQIIT